MEKTCTKCGESKLLSEYYKKKAGKYGRDSKCKLCKNAYQKAYSQTEAGKLYKKAYMKKYYQSEKGKAKKKAYYQSEARKSYVKAYYQSEARKAKKKAYNKAYKKNRRHNDPFYKLQCNLRSGFCNWIKGNIKTCSTEQYVGCTYNELLDHLESQFDEGMSWENHGEWQIDHFKAQSRFDPTDEEEKYMCWHWTNLQPMWAEINQSWRDKKKPGDEFIVWMGREIGWVNILAPGIEKI